MLFPNAVRSSTALLLFSCLAIAQAPSTGVISMRAIPTEGLAGLPGEGPFVVTGAPFCGDVVTTRTQTLADGNRLQNARTEHVCRDSQGRTRRELKPPETDSIAGVPAEHEPNMIVISDPIANVIITLQPMHHSLTSRPMRFMRVPTAPEAAATSTPPKAPVWNQVPRNNMHVTSRAGDDLVEENLGEQSVHGFLAKGTKITRTIPAGHMGNDLPIIIVTERWYSDELKTLLLMKQRDPRVGETVTEVINVVPGEPDASLFQVPAGYPDLKLLQPRNDSAPAR